MKKLIGLLILAAAVYSGVWYYGSTQAKEYVVNNLKESGGLTYGDIEVGGYPFSYEVKINKLKIDVASDDKIPALEIVFDEPLVFGTNLLGTQYWKSTSGVINFYVQGQEEKEHWILTGNNSVKVGLDEKVALGSIIRPFQNLPVLPTNEESATVLLNRINLFDLKMDHAKLVNTAISSIPVFEIENGNVLITRKPNEPIEVIDWNIDLRKFEVLWNYSEYFPSSENSLEKVAMMLAFPNPGKMTLVLKGNFKGPNQETIAALPQGMNLASTPAFDFNITKFDYSDDFKDSHSYGYISLKDPKDNARLFNIDLQSDSLTTPEQFARLQKAWEHFLDQTPICGKEAAFSDQEANPKACVSLKNILPKLADLGKIVSRIKVDANFKNLLEPDKNTALTVGNLDFTTALYGLKSRGDIQMHEDISGNYVISLSNYRSLVEDLVNYLDRVFAILPMLNAETAKGLPKSLGQDFKDALMSFLQEISDKPHEKMDSLNITIKWTNAHDVQIGTLNVAQFLEAWQKFDQSIKTEEDVPPAPSNEDHIENKQEEVIKKDAA